MASTFMLVWLPSKSINFSRARPGFISSAPSEPSTVSGSQYTQEMCAEPQNAEKSGYDSENLMCISRERKGQILSKWKVRKLEMWKFDRFIQLQCPFACCLLSHAGSQPLTLARGVSSDFCDLWSAQGTPSASSFQHPRNQSTGGPRTSSSTRKKNTDPLTTNKLVNSKFLAGDILAGGVQIERCL